MLIFLDLETTGLEHDDKICSIAYICDDAGKISYKYELVNEGKKIPPKASSIHHISNEMIKGKSKFLESEVFEFLDKYNNDNATLIAHNIKFDLEKLENAGFVWKGKVLDTLRVTKHLIPECELFSLQVLRYELKLYRSQEQEREKCGIKDAFFAHHALGDALVVKQLYEVLLEYASEKMMLLLTKQNVLQEKFSFGKYEGKYIEEVSLNDRGYLEWMIHTLKDLDDDMKYSINYYLEG